MKKGIFLHSLIGLLALSCTVQEIETQTPPYEPAPEDDVFYASLAPESDTKVYVDRIDEKVKTLWDEKDQISIFNKNTVNQQYEFMGKTGDNAGYFKRVSEVAVAAGDGDYVCAVYPFSQATSLDEGVLTLTLPKKQTYREGSYGLGANTMVSTTDGKNNLLRFKNVGGYLVLKFYGTQMVDGEEKAITIKSIKLEGRNGELLSGEAIMTPAIGELPFIEMAETAGTSITLDANKVKLGKNANKATEFWMVVPPTVFSEGFLLTVTDKDNKVFTKETDQRLEIERNGVLRIAPIEVKPALPLDPDKVIYYTTSDKNVVVPAEGADFGASIVSNDYVDLKGILAFDGSVTEIGAHAFEECETLTGMTIPSTVTSIGDYAFAGCTSLGAQNTPSGSDITEPTKGPSRSGETTFVIPEGVTSIGAYAFKDCESLTSIIIPDSVTSIGDGAFEGCTNLTDINIPDSVTDMGENVFNGCTSITSVTIPDGVESIEDYAFAGCENLTEIIIPETVKSIGQYAFYNCENLTSIDIPSSITSIGKSAFESCTGLTGITIPTDLEIIEEGTFAACHAFTSIVIPNNVKSIGRSAFECCSRLSNVTLSSGLTSIKSFAFAECRALTDITIPSTVSDIGGFILQYCVNLVSITVEASEPSEYVYEEAFMDTNECPIYVPTESVSAYKEANVWSLYASRIYAIRPQTGTINDHAYVNLGTGTKWSTVNVGASSIVEPGVLLAWSDGKAAAENWGEGWRLPTKDELEILTDESKFTWTWDSDNNGFLISSNIAGFVGNSIFLPAAGLGVPDEPYTIPETGYFWSSTPNEGGSYYYLEIDSADVPFTGQGHLSLQMSIRPVAD